MTALIVIAKQPLPGRSKTRLCPPCTPEQAAAVAEAALADTLQAVADTPAPRRVLCLDGEPGPWLPDGFEVMAQRGDGLDTRLANAFTDVGDPAVLVGMDTPQLTPQLIGEAVGVLESDGVDAVVGPALDGGYWTIGLRTPDTLALVGVPMSSDLTFARQLQRLDSLGMTIRVLPELTDVDTFEDAVQVASSVPGSRFAAAVALTGHAQGVARG